MTRILIVDDKEDGLYYLRALLGAHGFEIDSAHHGAEALSKARKAPPDVIVSDLLMPVMDGYTLLRHWKLDARLRPAPFIVYTATYTSEDDERLARELGADAFILKPSEPDVFLTHIREVLERTSTALPKAGEPAPRDDAGQLRQYSAVLIRKLEQKMIELEASNRSLQEDVRAREHAEAARDEAQHNASERAALLDALFASVPDLVMQLDLKGEVVVSNRGGVSGLPLDAALLRNAIAHGSARVLANGRPASFEINEGPRSHWVTITPVTRAGALSGAVVVVRDISERRQTEAKLIVADRMASLGSLAAGVAHEINNPLLCVTASLALVSSELEASARPLSKDAAEALRDARDGAERVRQIMRDLKIFSRGDDERRGPVSVEQVLESTLRMAWNELRHRARIVRRYTHVPDVDANEVRLGQVFLNLIVNAAQAIPEGNYERNEVRVETRVDPETQRVVVAISDTGTGIPAELRARIFEPFVTSKPVGVGTGLGLSICHRIVTALGGEIAFTSEPGKGTIFRVSLPMSSGVRTQESTPAARPSAATRRGKVLFVDDDNLVAQVVRRALAREHDVHIVNSASHALELLRAGERFDVVLCDLMMPQVTGMELYRVVLELDAEQAKRIVFVTGGAFTASARAFLEGVPNQRLEKPFELQRLKAVVNRQLT